jgi:hypothetical protein
VTLGSCGRLPDCATCNLSIGAATNGGRWWSKALEGAGVGTAPLHVLLSPTYHTKHPTTPPSPCHHPHHPCTTPSTHSPPKGHLPAVLLQREALTPPTVAQETPHAAAAAVPVLGRLVGCRQLCCCCLALLAAAAAPAWLPQALGCTACRRWKGYTSECCASTEELWGCLMMAC